MAANPNIRRHARWWAGIFALWLSLAPAATQAAPLFQSMSIYPAGAQPHSVAYGDFDGDGSLDVCIANLAANTVSVLLGYGDGTFKAKVDYNVGANPSAIAVGLFDGDGYPDLVVANMGGADISVLLGKGDGTFKPAAGYPAGMGSAPLAVAVGSFNGDSYLDLAVTSNTNTVNILVGDGQGGFTLPSTYSYATGTTPQSVAIGDFNEDHIQDIVTANYTSSDLSLLLGVGDGTFGAATTVPLQHNPVSVAAGNFDGNAGADIAVGALQSVSILPGNGLGQFGAEMANNLSGAVYSVVSADFDNDGVADLAGVDYYSHTAIVWQGSGGGALQNPAYYAVNAKPIAAVAADFDNDGNADLFVVNENSNDATVLPGNGDGTFQSPVVYLSGGPLTALASADFNNDGMPDMAVADETYQVVELLLGYGDGSYTHASYLTVGSGTSAIGVGHFNGDSFPDLVVVNTANDNVSVLLGYGDGTFAPKSNYSLLLGGSNAESIAVGDFNGDGYDDFAVTSRTYHYVEAYFANAGGTGAFTYSANYMVGMNPNAVIAKDFNGDSLLDLAVANSGSNDVSILLGAANGTFGSAASFAAGSGPSALVGGLFNGDAIPDLAVTDSGSDKVSLLPGNGDGTFGAAVTVSVGSNPVSLAAGDLDGVGGLDLAVTNKGNNTVSILTGNNDGTFTASDPIFTGKFSAPAAVAAVDFDGQQHIGLVVAENNWKRLSVYKPLPYRGTIQLQSSSYSVNENDGSSAITITRTGGSGVASALYGTSGGTAVAGVDYKAVSGRVVFQNGETSKTVSIPVLDDAASESDETVVFYLGSPLPGAIVGATSLATLTIADDDTAATPTPTPTPTATPTPTSTPTATPTMGPTPDPSSTPTPTPAPTPAPTPVPTVPPRPTPSLSPSPSPTPVPVAPAFSDIAGHWAEDIILASAREQWLHGYPDGTFRPDDPITRAEFAVMLMQFRGPQTAEVELPFADEERVGDWARAAIAQAVQLGILEGYPDGTFRPDQAITRAEIAKMIVGLYAMEPDGSGVAGFADDDQVPAWAEPAIRFARERHLMEGRDGNRFVPNDYATRAEAVAVISRLGPLRGSGE